MSSITGVTSTNGLFNIQTSSGESKSVAFGDLLLSMGMMQLELQDSYFEEQYKKASEMADEMREINEYVALFTRWKGNFNANGGVENTSEKSSEHSDCCELTKADKATWEAFCAKYVDTGKIDDSGDNDGVGEDGVYTLQDVTNLLTSTEAYQKNLSSMNEQEMMVTNQAASRRSNVLQQLQTLLTTEKEGRSAATR